MNVKLIVVFFACALAATQAQSQNESSNMMDMKLTIPSFILEQIDALKTKVQEVQEHIKKAVADLQQSVIDKVHATEDAVKASVDKVIQGAKDKVKDALERVKNTKADVSKCQATAAENLSAASQIAREQAALCVSSEVKEVKDRYTQAGEVSKQLSVVVTEMRSKISECMRTSSRKIDLVQCASNAVFDAVRSYTDLHKIYRQKVAEALKETAKFPAIVAKCERAVAKETTKMTGAIVAQNVDCIKEAVTNFGSKH